MTDSREKDIEEKERRRLYLSKEILSSEKARDNHVRSQEGRSERIS